MPVRAAGAPPLPPPHLPQAQAPTRPPPSCHPPPPPPPDFISPRLFPPNRSLPDPSPHPIPPHSTRPRPSQSHPTHITPPHLTLSHPTSPHLTPPPHPNPIYRSDDEAAALFWREADLSLQLNHMFTSSDPVVVLQSSAQPELLGMSRSRRLQGRSSGEQLTVAEDRGALLDAAVVRLLKVW